MIISYCCQSCDHEFEVEFTPAEPSEDLPATADPNGCPECAWCVDVALCEEEARATRPDLMRREKDGQ